jgi:very-short-patch-repair endonuclease
MVNCEICYSSPSLGGRELEGGGLSVSESQRQLAFARKLRQSQTDAEKALWARLRSKQLQGVKFRRQQPLGSYIVDFVSFERKIIIEIDGGQHNEREARKRDGARAAWLKGRGYHVLRFWNNEVLRNMEGVLEKIVEVLR